MSARPDARPDARPVLMARLFLADGSYRIRFEDRSVETGTLSLPADADPVDVFRALIEGYTGTDWTERATLIRTEGSDPILAYFGPNA